MTGTAAHSQCPLWVKSRHVQRERTCPLYPRKQTCAVQLGMSAKCQQRTLRALFDHLVGAPDQGVRDRNAERLGSPEIYNEIDLRRSLNWQFGRLLTFQNPSDIDAHLAPSIPPAGTIANQTSSRCELWLWVDRGNRVAERARGQSCNSSMYPPPL